MPNKIRDIFSDDKFNLNGNLRFKDNNAYKDFLNALKLVHAEGRVVPVEGATSITIGVSYRGAIFPLNEFTNISSLSLVPVETPVSIPLVGTGQKSITLLRSQTKDSVIFKSEPNSIVSFHFIFLLDKNSCTVDYKVQFEKAKNIKEIVDSFNIAGALLAELYNGEDEKTADRGKVSLTDMLEYFRCYEAFFKRLNAIENEFNLSISPSLLNKLSQEEQRDIDELYLLLYQKQVVRLNDKLTSADLTSVAMNNSNNAYSIKIGDKLALTFLSIKEFKFLRQTVRLHTANLMVNAFVKDIQENSDGSVKIMYCGTDSKPMYIAFSAFKNEEEAKQELNRILQHDKIYIDALTSDKYIRQFYSDI